MNDGSLYTADDPLLREVLAGIQTNHHRELELLHARHRDVVSKIKARWMVVVPDSPAGESTDDEQSPLVIADLVREALHDVPPKFTVKEHLLPQILRRHPTAAELSNRFRDRVGGILHRLTQRTNPPVGVAEPGVPGVKATIWKKLA